MAGRILFSLLGLLLLFQFSFAQTLAKAKLSYKLISIQVKGANRLSPEQIASASPAIPSLPVAGPAVALIHSLGSSVHMWRDTIAALKDRYTVIACDARGHGGSSPSYMAEVLLTEYKSQKRS